MYMVRIRKSIALSACPLNPLLRRGWQDDSRDPLNPNLPGLVPQKIPGS